MDKPLHNKKALRDYRKNLRNNLTSAEATLWKYLQNKKLKGRKFRRQHSINNFIVDFYCSQEKLIIELDGAGHLDFTQQIYDANRNSILEKQGFKILRFENKFVFEDLDYVLEEISQNFNTL